MCSSENIEDFAALAEELSVPDVDVIEANISCPTRNQTGGNFAMHEDYTRDCITAIRAKTKKPLWVKLSPNAGDIVSIASAAEDGRRRLPGDRQHVPVAEDPDRQFPPRARQQVRRAGLAGA